MAHPMKGEVQDAINAKMRKLTTHYGEADKKANIKAPVNKYKIEGPEEAVGFGANSDMASPRSDRPARKSVAANPVATYAKGGVVKNAMKQHGAKSALMQGGVDVTNGRGAKVTKHMVSNKIHADAAGGAISRARGGKAKHKGSTHVNVIVAPHPGNAAPPPQLPPNLAALAGGLKPPMMPPGLTGGGGPPPGAPPMGGPPPGAPPMMPPGGMPMRAKGGKVEDATSKNYRDEGLIRKARGGGVEGITFKDGQITKGGAVSGVGRLEKMLEFEKSGNKKKQEV